MSKSIYCKVCKSDSCFRYDHPDVSIFECTNCKHSFSMIKPECQQESYTSTYFEKTHKNWFENPNYKLFRSISTATISQDSSITLLDVGCGNLDFLSYLTKRYQNLQLTGIDLSSQKKMPGIDFIQTDFLKYESSVKFDLVYSIMTIEHIDDVTLFLKKLGSFTKKQGKLTITTINEDSFLYMCAKILRFMGIKLPFNRLYDKHHINHFSINSLKKLVSLNGFSFIQTIKHNVPLRCLDIPTNNIITQYLLRFAVFIIFILGNTFGKTYCQTIICKKD